MPIAFGSAHTGTATAAASVDITGVTGGTDQAYVLCVARRSGSAVSSVVGGGLTWTLRDTQGAGRNQITAEVWTAYGTPSSDPFTITVTMGSSTDTITANVVRATGADSGTTLTTVRSQNTNGLNGATTGGTDSASLTITQTVAVNDTLVINFGIARTGFTGGGTDADYTVCATADATGGSRVNNRSYRRLVTAGAPISPDTITHTADANTDWIMFSLAVESAAAGAQTITPDHIAAGAIYAPTVSNEAPQVITLGHIPAGAIYSPTVSNEGAAEPPSTRMVAWSSPPAGRPLEEVIVMRGEGGELLPIGADPARGVWHTGLTLSANRSGPDTCAFALMRDPTVSWPDLSPFNEVYVEIGGVPVWSGRMREAPGQSGATEQINVSASGWQSHLDDDLIHLGWVHSRLSAWRDATTYPVLSTAASYVSGLVVTTDGGEAVIGWPKGMTMSQDTQAAIAIDLGPYGPPVVRTVIDWSMRTIQNYTDAFVVGYPNAGFSGTPTNLIAKAASSFTAGVRSVNSATHAASRSLVIQLRRGTPFADITTATEHLLRIHAISMFADAADESGGVSDLRASTVIREVLSSGALPLLSSDAALIETTSFAIPHFWPDAPSSPREFIEPVNAFHDYDLGVGVDRRLFFTPTPTVATLEVGPWAGADFSDASAGSGEDVFNKVVVDALGTDGTTSEVIRTAATAAPERVVPATVAGQPSNPSFETDLSGWTLSNASYWTRSSTVAKAGSWSLRASEDISTAEQNAYTTLTGLTVGVVHQLTFSFRPTHNTAGSIFRALLSGVRTNPQINENYFDLRAGITTKDGDWPTVNTWRECVLRFVPQDTSVRLTLYSTLPSVALDSAYLYFDDFRLERLEVNTVDRHLFARAHRLNVSAPLSAAGAQVIGDTWLRNHIVTPLKGSLTVTAAGGVRDAHTGAPIHPAHLLLHHGRILRHGGMADPDTGSWGRNGRVASVSYSGGQAIVELDNERGRFEALVSRFAALSAQ